LSLHGQTKKLWSATWAKKGHRIGRARVTRCSLAAERAASAAGQPMSFCMIGEQQRSCSQGAVLAFAVPFSDGAAGDEFNSEHNRVSLFRVVQPYWIDNSIAPMHDSIKRNELTLYVQWNLLI
jgi:hypothetical protein